MVSLIQMIFICGDVSVGKSSFFKLQTTRTFPIEYKPTIGVDFGQYRVPLSGISKYDSLILQFWDFSGDPNFNPQMNQYLAGIHYVIIMYDCSNRGSFENIHIWIEKISKGLDINDITLFIIANKTDLRTTAKEFITTNEGADLIENLKKKFLLSSEKVNFLEMSAKTGDGLDNFVKTITNICINKYC